MTSRAVTRVGGTSVRARLAAILMERELGQLIPSVQDLQASLQVGSGTVIKALRELEDIGAVELKARKRLGTVVTARHIGHLWNAADLGHLRLVMPPPGPIEQQAICVGTQEALAKVGIPVIVDFLGGARNRMLEVFHENCHVAVTSASAYAKNAEELAGLVSVDLGEGTYYADDSLVVLHKTDRLVPDRPRIGIDHGSFDHEQLTIAEFGDRAPEYVECEFVRAPAAVLAGRVDAAVWHRLPTVIPPHLAGLALDPLSQPTTLGLLPTISHATLVSRGLDAATNAALREIRVSSIAHLHAEFVRRLERDELVGPASWPR